MKELKPIIGKIQSYTTEEGKTVMLKCVRFTRCPDCFFRNKNCLGVRCEEFGVSAMFIVAGDKELIENDIETLERIAKEHKGRTIENIIENLKQRQKEAEK